jgi:hypothetical protein
MYQDWLSYRRANHDQDGFKLMMAAAGGPVERVPGQPRLGRVLGGRVVMGHLPLSRWAAAAAAALSARLAAAAVFDSTNASAAIIGS